MKISEQLLQEGLEEAVSQSLENMAFIEVEMGEKLDDFPGFHSTDLFVTVSVSKPLSGSLHLVLPDQLVTELTETVAEDEAGDALKKDVLSELANTIAGRFLAHVFPRQEFEMGIPVCRKPESYHFSRNDPALIMKFDAEGNEVLGVFEYEE
jgi:CheY-specific phosphatase CheX